MNHLNKIIKSPSFLKALFRPVFLFSIKETCINIFLAFPFFVVDKFVLFSFVWLPLLLWIFLLPGLQLQ